MTFDLDQFISDCRDAVREDSSHTLVQEVVTRAMSAPEAVIRQLGEPQVGGISSLYRSLELTILNVVWTPWMTLLPHNHQMWAVIGVYSGREDNIFWRRMKDSQVGKLEAAGAKALSVGDTLPLGRDIIHSVNNPIRRLTGAIHVYGGDFFAVARSEWDAETLLEQSSDGEKMAQRLDQANAFWKLSAMSSSRS
jgi:predicted metal-dependent enzyme (double-stranded beta helix superfamily)